MSDFDKNMRDALGGDSGFDSNRAKAAQEEVDKAFQKVFDRYRWGATAAACVLIFVAEYCVMGFALHATTTQQWVGYSTIGLVAFLLLFLCTILYTMLASQLVTTKEIKQLRISMSHGTTSADQPVPRPLKTSVRQRIVGACAVLICSALGMVTGYASNSQIDRWVLQPQGQIEAHQTVTLGRMPHDFSGFWPVTPPTENAVLKSASLNGKPVTVSTCGTRANGASYYHVELPGSMRLTRDTVELVWSFPLSTLATKDTFQAPLRSVVPVRAYSLTLSLADNCGYRFVADNWKFGKTPEELKNEAEARRWSKLFWTSDRPTGSDFGTCGLCIEPDGAH